MVPWCCTVLKAEMHRCPGRYLPAGYFPVLLRGGARQAPGCRCLVMSQEGTWAPTRLVILVTYSCSSPFRFSLAVSRLSPLARGHPRQRRRILTRLLEQASDTPKTRGSEGSPCSGVLLYEVRRHESERPSNSRDGAATNLHRPSHTLSELRRVGRLASVGHWGFAKLASISLFRLDPVPPNEPLRPSSASHIMTRSPSGIFASWAFIQ